ncbi:MAG: hypothetical protein FJ302_11320 [Planctomycetes bacterium]|nr:hypothetical protein [Planctomycetota bacterium]
MSPIAELGLPHGQDAPIQADCKILQITQRFVESVNSGNCRSFAEAAQALVDFGQDADFVVERLKSIVPALLTIPLGKLAAQTRLPYRCYSSCDLIDAIQAAAQAHNWYAVAEYFYDGEKRIVVEEVMMDLAPFVKDRETQRWLQLGLADPSSPSHAQTISRRNPLFHFATELRFRRAVSVSAQLNDKSTVLRRGSQVIILGENPEAVKSPVFLHAEEFSGSRWRQGTHSPDMRSTPFDLNDYLLDFDGPRLRCRLADRAFVNLSTLIYAFLDVAAVMQFDDLLWTWVQDHALGLGELVDTWQSAPAVDTLDRIRSICLAAGHPEDAVSGVLEQLPRWTRETLIQRYLTTARDFCVQ